MVEVRVATPQDAADVARLLRDFNTEYGEIVPPHDELTERMASLIEAGDTQALLVGEPAVGLAVLRFRQAIWADAQECYLAELYVAPSLRGKGLGSGLLDASLAAARARGCAWIDLGTSEDDTAARTLYESRGFINREGPDGPVQYVYERDL
jgi:ribosomal protein S18 acetylase RimI-like enzyme